MLGATITGAMMHPVSIPSRTEELTAQGKQDWLSGIELIKTCMATHEMAT